MIGPRPSVGVSEEEEAPVTDPTPGAPAPDELQFDRAEPAGPTAATACAVCKQAITTSYFEINGKIACARCRGRILSVWNRGPSLQRGAKAAGLGALAAALGAAVYFAIAALTGYEFGLIAVLVGLAVGVAVRKGSGGRGGWRYQLLAMFLTYSAVVATDSGLIARELRQDLRIRVDSLKARGVLDASARRAAVVAELPTLADTAAARRRAPAHPGPLAVALAFALLLALAYAAPIMIGMGSPLHLLIAAFALYEAWKLNRGAAFTVTGPYALAARAASPSP
jgi:DNA-directed RNA polymerase subunit RPC12/RpoP